MKKEDKEILIAKLGEQINEYPHFYLVDVHGLNAEATSNLRRKCFGAGIKMVVVKNTLLQKALEKSEIDYSPLFDSLKGSTAVCPKPDGRQGPAVPLPHQLADQCLQL